MEKYLKLHPIYTSAAIVLLISIAYVSLMPASGLPKPEFNHIDKLVHLTMYFILSIIMVKGFLNLECSSKKIMLIPILMSFLYSVGIEFLQEMCTNSRFFEIFDILANGIGCLLAAMLVNTRFLNKKLNII